MRNMLSSIVNIAILLPVLLLSTQVSAQADSEEVNCDAPVSTLDVNYCIGVELGKHEDRLAKYYKAVEERISYDPETVAELAVSQKAWEEYRETYCSAVYSYWRDGTIRGAMHLSCQIDLTVERTHTIWRDYLTYMDSTPPVLPEPKKELP